MSCPDWRVLCDQRDADELEPGLWQDALGHLDDCPDCSSDAQAADATLMFRRLPAPEIGDDEVAAMQLAVAGMRRRAKIAPRRSAASGPWMRAAAMAAVLLGSVMLSGSEPRLDEPPASQQTAEVHSPAKGTVGTESESSLPGGVKSEGFLSRAVEVAPMLAAARSASRLPLVEMADPSYGSIIEVVDQDISVVVVLPADV